MTPDLGMLSDVATGLLAPPSGTPPRIVRTIGSSVPALRHVPLRMLRDGAIVPPPCASRSAVVAPLSAFNSSI